MHNNAHLSVRVGLFVNKVKRHNLFKPTWLTLYCNNQRALLLKQGLILSNSK